VQSPVKRPGNSGISATIKLVGFALKTYPGTSPVVDVRSDKKSGARSALLKDVAIRLLRRLGVRPYPRLLLQPYHRLLSRRLHQSLLSSALNFCPYASTAVTAVRSHAEEKESQDACKVLHVAGQRLYDIR
jgi:hypothetical protein